MSDGQENPSGGIVFTLVLVLFTLGQLLGLILLYTNWDLLAPSELGWLIVIITITLAVTAMVALVGVWRWRPGGVFLCWD
ncbi:MAG: hypothetical protein ACRDTC_10100 [Pseudonocardiaceae bacterium]